MIPPLPSAFLERPIAHRALHDVSDGRPENSRAAIQAAIDAGYGIEIDLQLSADDQAMVFHDYDLARLAHSTGPIRGVSASDLASIQLRHGDETIPSFAEVLDLVAGQTPLLIELKDQDGAMGTNLGPLERAVAAALSKYDGPAAVMSFNPHSVALMADHAPDVPRGITTCDYQADHWPLLKEARRAELRGIPDFDRVGASFISHDSRALHDDAVTKLKGKVPILCWTIKSAQQEETARKIADNVTFEGYLA